MAQKCHLSPPFGYLHNLPLKHRGGLSVGHSLRARVQRWIATIKGRSLEGVVVQEFLGIIERGKPHAEVFQLNTGRLSTLILRGTGIGRVSCEGNEGNGLECDI